MNRFTAEEFKKLAKLENTFCVSLLMPAHPTGRETKQDPIRLKNLIKEAESQLHARGRSPEEVRKQLAPARQRLDDKAFWAHQEEGLALYCQPEETNIYRVPFPLPERAMVGRRCYLTPLIPVISEDTRFFVLAISPKQVRLFEGTRYGSHEMELPGWPEDFEELARYLESEPQLQFHTGAQPTAEGNSDRAAVFHGHPGGDASTERKQRLAEYCRLVDRRLHEAVGDSRLPLVLACDERLASIYRETSKYSRILKQPVTGNPDDCKPADLRVHAWETVKSLIDETRDVAISNYHEAAASGLATSRLETMVPAAHEGRVGTLFLEEGAESWGQYDSTRQKLDLHSNPGPEDEELLNLLALFSFARGADVYNLSRDEFPEKEGPVAAILRY